jgi:hypothetical protein
MTFHSKDNSAEQDNAHISNTLAELDKLNDNLSMKVANDISQARINALKTAKAQQEQSLLSTRKTWLSRFFATILIPKTVLPVGAVAAIVIIFSLTKLSSQTIPELPQALVNVDMPNEDLALLQDLEFVTWLAEHEQEI